MSVWLGICASLVSSAGLAGLLVVTQAWHGALSMDMAQGIQKAHTVPTPRVGGVPVVLALVVLYGAGGAGLSEHSRVLLGTLLCAGVPAFVFGLLEDLTKRVSVLVRLLATMASGGLGWYLSGDALTRVDVWGLDGLLAWLPAGVLFTAFAVGGVANALNIVDGFNGLASSTAVWAFAGYGWMAWQVGDWALAELCVCLAAAVLGFFVWNWPWGKLFLGDGGSYFIGFALAWVAVWLLARHPSISAFAVLAVLAHPVTEVLFSIYRRRVRQQHPGQPDRWHFHSLFKRRYVARWFKNRSATWVNSVAGLCMGAWTLVAASLAVGVAQSVWGSVWLCLGLVCLYLVCYGRMVRHRWVTPWRFLWGSAAKRVQTPVA